MTWVCLHDNLSCYGLPILGGGGGVFNLLMYSLTSVTVYCVAGIPKDSAIRPCTLSAKSAALSSSPTVCTGRTLGETQ